jgi:hypothetical protein
MLPVPEKKLFLGGRLRRLRRELGLTQTKMAADLGLSPSYLNHLERNQRPVTAQLLLKLAGAYDVDLRTFSAEPDAAGAADLAEAFADPLFRDLAISRHEIGEITQNAPAAAEAVVRLYRAFRDQGRRAELGGDPEVGDPERGAFTTPADWVGEFIQNRRNHFPELETAAEASVASLGRPSDMAEAVRERLAARRIGVKVMPVRAMTGALRRYDIHRRRLLLSETLDAESRAFATAYQLALIEQNELLDALAEAAAPPDLATRRLLKVSLTNYFAAALLMPYGPFHAAAEELGYDLDVLKARFGVSYEQACHRLTTLSRPGARGVPFFMLRVDSAGNVSKRFTSGPFPFSRFGGACPRWNLHSVFKTPGRIVTQVVETPDGAPYFTLSRTVRRPPAPHPGPLSELAIGLGCELKHAPRLVYGRGLNLEAPDATAIGPTCRLCERVNCPDRAAPPLARTLTVEEWVKSVSPYPFSAHG